MCREYGIFHIALICLSLCFVATPAIAVGEGKVCGGKRGIQCDKGLWCDPAPGMCRVSDVEGKCVRIVEKDDLCPKDYMPNCGCENNTYSNDCERVRAKEPKKHDGPCK